MWKESVALLSNRKEKIMKNLPIAARTADGQGIMAEVLETQGYYKTAWQRLAAKVALFLRRMFCPQQH